MNEQRYRDGQVAYRRNDKPDANEHQHVWTYDPQLFKEQELPLADHVAKRRNDLLEIGIYENGVQLAQSAKKINRGNNDLQKYKIRCVTVGVVDPAIVK